MSVTGYLKAQHEDCTLALPVCDGSAFVIGNGGGAGLLELLNMSYSNPQYNVNQIPGNSGCIPNGDDNSIWIQFPISQSGILEFTLSSSSNSHLYAWNLYKENSQTCSDIHADILAPVACNRNGSSPTVFNSTGMRFPSNLGPMMPANNFEYPIAVNSGESYIMCIKRLDGAADTLTFNITGSAQICGSPSTQCNGSDLTFIEHTIQLPTCALYDDAGLGTTITCSSDSTLFVCNGDTNYTGTFSGLYTGVYYVEMTDSMGCTILSSHQIPHQSYESTYIVFDTLLCPNDCDTLVSLNSNLDSISWYYDGALYASTDTINFCYTGGDTLMAFGFDNSGCPTDTSIAIFRDPNTAVNTLHGMFDSVYYHSNLSPCVLPPSPSYTYTWDNGDTTICSDYTATSSGNYCVIVNSQCTTPDTLCEYVYVDTSLVNDSAACADKYHICHLNEFAVTNSGYGWVNELAGNSISNPSTNPNTIPGNPGCLLASEHNGYWLEMIITGSGMLEFSLETKSGSAGCLDWAMWEQNGKACSDISGDSLPPVACNWNSTCGGITGISDSLNLPPTASPLDFEYPLNVSVGDTFIICLDNYSAITDTIVLKSFGSATICTSGNPLSSPTINSKNKITLYPNPSSDEIHIKLDSPINSSEVRIFSIHGKLVKQTTCFGSEFTLNTNELAPGTYVLQVENYPPQRFIKQ